MLLLINKYITAFKKPFNVMIFPLIKTHSFISTNLESLNFRFIYFFSDKKPYFDNIPSQIHVFDHLAINDVVWTLDPQDTENDDISVSLSQTNTYFKLSSST